MNLYKRTINKEVNYETLCHSSEVMENNALSPKHTGYAVLFSSSRNPKFHIGESKRMQVFYKYAVQFEKRIEYFETFNEAIEYSLKLECASDILQVPCQTTYQN